MPFMTKSEGDIMFIQKAPTCGGAITPVDIIRNRMSLRVSCSHPESMVIMDFSLCRPGELQDLRWSTFLDGPKGVKVTEF